MATFQLRPGFWSEFQSNLTVDQRALGFLRTLEEYRIPGYRRPAGDPLDPYGDVSARLIDLGLASCAQEPLGVYNNDGQEEYGTVYRITEAGLEELGCWE